MSLFILLLCGSICHGAVYSPWIDNGIVVDYVNQLRERHRAQDIVWDDGMTQSSLNWTEYMALANYWGHSKMPYGENLASFGVGKRFPENITSFFISAIDMWYAEVKLYDFNKPGWSTKTGHFTQLVWSSSDKVGFSASYSDKYMTLYVCMLFGPPGNGGRYQDNVFKAIETPPPSPPPMAQPYLRPRMRSPAPPKRPNPSLSMPNPPRRFGSPLQRSPSPPLPPLPRVPRLKYIFPPRPPRPPRPPKPPMPPRVPRKLLR